MAQPADDFEARFEEIVAHFDDPDSDPVAQSGPATGRPPEPTPLQIPTQWRIPPQNAGPSMLDEESRFVPPDPRMPEGDPMFYAILAGLVGGPLWMLYLYLFDRYTRPLWWWLAGGAFFVALIALFLRQPARREDDDDGAVV